MEDLEARIDSPLLDCLELILFHQLIFDTPQLTQFISRTPTLEVRDQARVDFSDWHIRVTFPKMYSGYHLSLKLLCIEWRERSTFLTSADPTTFRSSVRGIRGMAEQFPPAFPSITDALGAMTGDPLC